MEIKAIHDEAGYRAALAELDSIWDAPKGSPGSDRMEVLTILVADYERQHHAISRWMGKWKVSQNQPLCNRDSVVAHLGQQKQPDSEAMAEYVPTGRKNGKKDYPG